LALKAYEAEYKKFKEHSKRRWQYESV
jgi:hypothetical protein